MRKFSQDTSDCAGSSSQPQFQMVSPMNSVIWCNVKWSKLRQLLLVQSIFFPCCALTQRVIPPPAVSAALSRNIGVSLTFRPFPGEQVCSGRDRATQGCRAPTVRHALLVPGRCVRMTSRERCDTCTLPPAASWCIPEKANRRKPQTFAEFQSSSPGFNFNRVELI